ncbi:MAG: hypothetical protein A2017_13995 [Lentisphaerae bacterium GWF2_44_16]|nr:MAG: hypothetical protein A2017_13995 [Lentisphaerae bacterium GWF2_44_16]
MGKTKIRFFTAGIFFFFLNLSVHAQNKNEIVSSLDKKYPELESFYKYMHSHPELSLQEKETSATIAKRLRKSGYSVSENIGGYGVVGIMKNGEGPVVALRADMDALPVTEKTGLPYASKLIGKDKNGNDTGIMHACGHDIHCTVMLGSAGVLAENKDLWHGTLVMIAQPGEEGCLGAKAMIKDGLFTRFPRPNYILGLHVSPLFPSGSIAFKEGEAMAGSLSVFITVRGIGGHAAMPNLTKDPVVLSAEIIMALQTILSRELAPGIPSVVTVSSIHGGTAFNIIPDKVELSLSVRYPSPEVRDKILSAIKRICEGSAVAAGLPDALMPLVSYQMEKEYIPLYNNIELSRKAGTVFEKTFGKDKVFPAPFMTWAEDFAFYSHENPPIPTFFYFIGANDPLFLESIKGKAITELDPVSAAGRLTLHSPYFAPSPENTIKTGVAAMCAAVLELMKKK